MNCPQCQAVMHEMEYEGVRVRTCDACGGEFIGADELGHIVRLREERFPPSLQAEYADHRPQSGLNSTELERDLDCPQCNCPMSVINYCGDTGVHVDRCQACGGLWLDQGELEKVQILVERWADEAPAQIRAAASAIEHARQAAAARTCNAFSGSRFAFVNAMINRFLDAA